jgi:hypothetical protein
VTVREFRWASETGANGMPYPAELEYLGWTRVLRDGQECRDPRYPHSLLMERSA